MSNGDPGLTIGEAPDFPALDDCGCCAGLDAGTPAAIFNRHGLSAIAYRIGSHATFKQSMLARLSAADLAPLAKLRSRADDDFTIALLDAWSTVADILTFYQERIANESYLRSATERLSIGEMARLIGYQPRPGVAAGVDLAFTLDQAAGAPEQAAKPTTIEVGTRAQSIPGPGESARMFETIEAITARPEWNALKPRLRQPLTPGFAASVLYLEGTATDLKAGDAILLVGDERIANPGSERWDFRRVRTVVADHDAGVTRVDWQPGLGSFDPFMLPAQNPKAYALRLRASLFGYNAPSPRSLHSSIQLQYDNIDTTSHEWTFPISGQTIDLDGAHGAIRAGSWLVLSKPAYRELYRVTRTSEAAMARYAISGKTTRIQLDTDENLSGYSGANYRDTTAFADSDELTIADAPIEQPVWQAEVVLDRTIEALEAGRRVIVRGKRARATVLAAGLSLTSDDHPAVIKVLVPGQSVVVLGAPAAVTNVPGLKVWRLRDADGTSGVVTTAAASFAFIAADKSDDSVAETAFLKETDLADAGHTKLVFTAPLANAYDRATTEILANVAHATDGETTGDMLGGGDAGASFQRFGLRQSPLTHVSAATPSGTELTLKVWVNDILWNEVPNLYGQGPQDRVYFTATDDAGRTTVGFGDGVAGARLPSGPNNVRATYRKGIGLAGLTGPGQISLLLAKPLGVNGVNNPIAATGAADPETREQARDNAPITVLTLDRAVSLSDYQDFARSFAGIAKAQASWAWDRQTRRVFVTVAGPNGAEIDDDGALRKTLLAALRSYGDPHVAVDVRSYRPAFFRLKLKVKVRADYAAERVLTDVETALRQRFSFAARAFGQPVAQSEVVAAAQAVAGVVAVDLDLFYRVTPPDHDLTVHERLLAIQPALAGDGTMTPAELLTIDSGPFDGLEVMP